MLEHNDGSVTKSAPGTSVPLQRTARLGATVLKTPNAELEWRNPEPGWLHYGTRPYLFLLDIVAFAVATLITTPTSPIHILVLGVNFIVFSAAGLYRSRLSLSLLDDFPYLLAASLVGFALKVTLFGLLPSVDPPRMQVVHAAVLLGVGGAFRWAAYFAVRRARSKGLVQHRTVVLGAGSLGQYLAQTMLDHRDYGLTAVGFIDSNPPREDAALLPVPVLGPYEQLSRLIREHNIRDVVVAWAAENEPDLVEVLRTCDRLDVEVFVVPRLFELHQANRDTDDLWGIPLLRRRRAAFRSPWWKVKRLIDVLVSAAALILLSPVLAACALAVRLEGGPGIIFRQERVGLDGRPFQVLKFRSLKPVNESESQTNWNIKHDDRLGPVGKFLRASSLDELPQLYNILRGDMSLVGPRPERPYFVEQFATHIPRYTARHRVPAGLTGWAQAHGLRGDTSIEDRARFDNYYIENWSPWLDIKIVFKTVGQVLRRQGG